VSCSNLAGHHGTHIVCAHTHIGAVGESHGCGSHSVAQASVCGDHTVGVGEDMAVGGDQGRVGLSLAVDIVRDRVDGRVVDSSVSDHTHIVRAAVSQGIGNVGSRGNLTHSVGLRVSVSLAVDVVREGVGHGSGADHRDSVDWVDSADHRDGRDSSSHCGHTAGTHSSHSGHQAVPIVHTCDDTSSSGTCGYLPESVGLGISEIRNPPNQILNDERCHGES